MQDPPNMNQDMIFSNIKIKDIKDLCKELTDDLSLKEFFEIIKTHLFEFRQEPPIDKKIDDRPNEIEKRDEPKEMFNDMDIIITIQDLKEAIDSLDDNATLDELLNKLNIEIKMFMPQHDGR